MDTLPYLALLIAIAVIVTVLVLKRANAQQSNWGINFRALNPGNPLTCPNCDASLPVVRKPENLRQMLWGGFTCETCGKEYDKWLKEIST